MSSQDQQQQQQQQHKRGRRLWNQVIKQLKPKWNPHTAKEPVVFRTTPKRGERDQIFLSRDFCLYYLSEKNLYKSPVLSHTIAEQLVHQLGLRAEDKQKIIDSHEEQNNTTMKRRKNNKNPSLFIQVLTEYLKHLSFDEKKGFISHFVLPNNNSSGGCIQSFHDENANKSTNGNKSNQENQSSDSESSCSSDEESSDDGADYSEEEEDDEEKETIQVLHLMWEICELLPKNTSKLLQMLLRDFDNNGGEKSTAVFSSSGLSNSNELSNCDVTTSIDSCESFQNVGILRKRSRQEKTRSSHSPSLKRRRARVGETKPNLQIG